MTLSSFYSSNQQKLKVYTADRRVEDKNGNLQQAKVYAKIAQDMGDIETADRFAKLGMSIIGKIGQTEVPIVNEKGGVVKLTVFDHIKAMIESGSLSNWWEAVKNIPPKKLSAKARIVQNDIKHNVQLKEFINEHLKSIVSSIAGKNDYSAIVKEMVDGITGGDMNVLQEFEDKTSITATVASEQDILDLPKPSTKAIPHEVSLEKARTALELYRAGIKRSGATKAEYDNVVNDFKKTIANVARTVNNPFAQDVALAKELLDTGLFKPPSKPTKNSTYQYLSDVQ